jgi:hypothetical protein
MFEKFAEDLHKVYEQLMEGAITYEEYFNKAATMSLDLVESDEYINYIDKQEVKVDQG